MGEILKWGVGVTEKKKITNDGVSILFFFTGKDLTTSADITKALLELICEHHVHWENAIAAKDLTHIIDFGPGGTSGIGGLTYRNKEGTGVQIVLAGAFEGSNRDLSYKADLFDSDIRAVTYSQDWAKLFQPKLVETTR